ncbi:MAG TPA: HAD-IIIA family hydrolase [Myxococcaceae bacterium]|nr:HAD-IIIA family hydrolase [Myxococcaceae bacterium]
MVRRARAAARSGAASRRAGVRVPALSLQELARRAARLRRVLTDSDGELTDTGVYYSERGEELKRFSIRDGMGVERLREAGIETGIVTGERSPSVLRRAEKLALPHVLLGVKDKLGAVRALCETQGLTLEEVGYIGDDVNDLEVLRVLTARGLTGAPADGLPGVLAVVTHVCSAPGGHGAFRDFAEWILAHRAAASSPRRSSRT